MMKSVKIIPHQIGCDKVYHLEINGSHCEPIDFEMMVEELRMLFGETNNKRAPLRIKGGLCSYGVTKPKVILKVRETVAHAGKRTRWFMTPKELAIQALENMKSDDLYRARAAFRGMTSKQMQEQYGQSGKTREQIIADYEKHEDRVNAAIAWVRAATGVWP